MFDRIKPFAAVAVISALALVQPAQAEGTSTADTVMATVDGTDITLGHMIALRDSLPSQYSQVPAGILFDGILEQLVQQTLLMHSFEGDLKRKNRLTLENESRAFAAGEVIDDIMGEPVTEEALQSAYEKQYMNDDQKTEYQAAHILVSTEDEAKALIDQLNADADFATLAKEFSTGPSGAGGGDLGWFSEGQMVDSFFAAVVELKPGEVSAPVKSRFGWHVIKLNETRTMERPELDAVRAEIEDKLRQAAFDNYIGKLTKAATIDRPDRTGIDPALIDDISLLEN